MLDELFAALRIATWDVRLLVRPRQTLVWMIVMPLVFIYFMGAFTSGFSGVSNETRTLALSDGRSTGMHEQTLGRELERRGYRVVEAKAARSDEVTAELSIDPMFGSPASPSSQPVARLKLEREGRTSAWDILRVQHALWAALFEIADVERAPQEPETRPLGALGLDVRVDGEHHEYPHGYQHTIPGVLIVLQLLLLMTSGATLVVIGRRDGMLRRLFASPLSRTTIVCGQWGGKLFFGLIQTACALVIATVLFPIDWGPDRIGVCLVLVLSAALCAAGGLLVGALAHSESQALTLGAILANALSFFGGAWIPVAMMPAPMQRIAAWLPSGWAIDALHRLINYRMGCASIWPHLAGLCACTLATLWLCARKLRPI